MAKNKGFDELFAVATQKAFNKEVKTEETNQEQEPIQEVNVIKEEKSQVTDKEMRFTLRLKKSVYDDLKKQADIEDDSLNHLIVKAVKYYISTQNSQNV